MRLYSFTNMYTAGIHAGIQTAHLVHEMMRKYEKKGESQKLTNLHEWADKHKTIIVKCGGYHSSLVELYDELKEYSAHFHLPMGRFRESKEALNNAQTAVGIVLPSFVYNFKTPPGYIHMWPRTPFDDDIEMAYKLNQLINRYGRAT